MSVSELKLLVEAEARTRLDVVGWVFRLSASALFLSVGIEKFQAESYWVNLFTDIGFGDWFRYLTGVIQVVGGLLLMAPRPMRLGALFVGGTMAGAVVVHLLVLDTGVGGAVIPAALLIFVVVIVLRRPE